MDRDPQDDKPSDSLTVFEKAQRFRTHAELIHAHQAGTDELERISHRVAELRTGLQKMSRTLSTAHAIASLPDAPSIVTTGDDGYTDFKRRVDAGDFKDAVFKTAMRKLSSASSTIETETQDAWKTWTAQRLSRLLTNRVAILPTEQRKRVTDRRTRLDRLASAAPDRAAVTEFLTTYESLLEELDELPDLPAELVELLDRLAQRKPLTLADLSEEDLKMLRESEVGAQIELRRRES